MAGRAVTRVAATTTMKKIRWISVRLDLFMKYGSEKEVNLREESLARNDDKVLTTREKWYLRGKYLGTQSKTGLSPLR